MNRGRSSHGNVQRLRLLFIGCVALAVLGCETTGDESPSGGEASAPPSGMQVRLAFARQATFEAVIAEVRCMILRVTGPGIESPLGAQQTLVSEDRSVVFEINVPVGNARVFTVETFAEVEACQSESFTPTFLPTFRGEKVVDVLPAAATVTVNLSLLTDLEVRSPGAQNVEEGEALALSIIAGDPASRPLTFQATGLPQNLSIDPTTGAISGVLTNTAAFASPYSITVLASNGTRSNSATFLINVTNPAPTISLPFLPENQENTVGDRVELRPVAEDPDGDLLTFSASGLPPGLQIDENTGLINGLIPLSAVADSPYTVTITVSDGVDTDQVGFTWVVHPVLSINDVQLTEGNDSTVDALFTVSLSMATAQIVTVDFATADGTATAGVDYQTTSGILTFAPNTLSQTLTVLVLGDVLDEDEETFVVLLGTPSNAGLADAQGLGTIRDNDTAALTINDVAVIEGSGTSTANFTVTLSGPSVRTVTVDVTTVNGTATAGTDYLSTTTTLTFPPGTVAVPFVVPILGDTLDEANETFLVILSNPTNAILADAQGLGTILDTTPPPTLSINDVSVVEGNGDAVTAIFTMTLSAPSALTVTVNVATADDTATADGDYDAASGIVTFPPGTVTQSFTVSIQGDTTVEADETFLVTLSNATNATLADNQGIGTILNDDIPLFTISQSDPCLRQIDPEDGATLASVTLRLDGEAIIGGAALTTSPITGALWAIVDTDDETPSLVTINPTTGVVTFIGSVEGNFVSIAFDNAGTLFAVESTLSGDGSGVNLATLSLIDATSTPLCPLPSDFPNSGNAIAFHSTDATLYRRALVGGSGLFERLDSIGVSCTATTIPPVTGSAFIEDPLGLTFWEAEGVFLAVGFNQFASEFAPIVLERLSTDGVVSILAALDHDANGLAFNNLPLVNDDCHEPSDLLISGIQ